MAAELGLGRDLDKLSAGETARLNVVVGLTLALEEMRSRQYRGEAVDVAKLLSAATALQEYLPRRAEARASASDARARVMQMILSAVEAERTELAERAARGEPLSEAERLRLRLHEIEAAEAAPADQGAEADPVESDALAAAQREVELLRSENRHLRGIEPRRLPPPSAKPMKAAKPDTASAAPSAPSAKLTGAWSGPQDGPCPWLVSPAANAARQPSGENAPPPSAPVPPPAPSWDDTPGGRAWHMWRDSGGATDWWRHLPGRSREW